MTGVFNEYTRLLTFEQIKTSYSPLAEELEGYLEKEYGDWEINAWDYLAMIYLHMREMEKCLDTRCRGYEATGWETMRPEPYEGDNGYATDEYGRIVATEGDATYTYKNADCIATMDKKEYEEYDVFAIEYEYDSEGRFVAYSEKSQQDGYIGIARWELEYQDDNTAVVVWRWWGEQVDEHLSTAVLNYDEYGIRTEQNLQWEYQY